MTPENLLNMSNEELREWFRSEIIESESDPEWERRLKEYHQNIERDFQEEWSKKRFKWFFTKRRQKKLRSKIFRRYEGPIFWMIQDALDDLWPLSLSNGGFFDQLVDFKNISKDEKFFADNMQEPKAILYNSDRILWKLRADELNSTKGEPK